MRRVCEEDGCYIYKYRPFKISRLQGVRDENLVTKSDNIRFKGKFLDVVQWVLLEIYANDRDFVVSYNSKFNHNESTYEIDVPSNFGPYSRINIQLQYLQLPEKTSLGKDAKLYLIFRKMIIMKK